ncbi:MAG: hypothetical protein KF749_03195 [Bacteroidetes bacterium]|nr:hypothetical protein [Bacteroidota bacterium]MCW5895496.1 hypothetical protein [Bacteroidota bacterium]
MAKSKKKYPAGYKEHMTVREASDFWDEHSLVEFDDIKEVDVTFDLIGEKHAILIDDKVARRIRSLARKKRLPQHEVVNQLLQMSLDKID